MAKAGLVEHDRMECRRLENLFRGLCEAYLGGSGSARQLGGFHLVGMVGLLGLSLFTALRLYLLSNSLPTASEDCDAVKM